ncbi:MAG: FmdB family zinc ribbon protein [candidate division Zixibacteria bacterium]
MPTYEYKCFDCEKKFEEFQSINDPSLTNCVYCGGKVQRLISGGSGLLFKGSGFYITDYRSDSYKKDASRDKPSPAKVDTKSSKDNKTSSAKKKPSGDS